MGQIVLWPIHKSSNQSEGENVFSAIYVIVAKALDGQQYPLPLCKWMCDGERAAGFELE